MLPFKLSECPFCESPFSIEWDQFHRCHDCRRVLWRENRVWKYCWIDQIYFKDEATLGDLIIESEKDHLPVLPWEST